MDTYFITNYNKMYWHLIHAKHVLKSGRSLQPGGAFHIELNFILHNAEMAEMFKIKRPEEHTMSRNSDPHTSSEAVKKVNVTKQMEDVLLNLQRHNGTSSRVLAEVCCIDRYMVGRRMPDLEKAGMVERKHELAVDPGKAQPLYKCDSGGTRWFVTEMGKRYETKQA